MYDIEGIYQAKNVQDAIAALVRQPDAVVISGGSDVLIRIREGKLAGCRLVSIHNIPELKEIYREADGTIVIGPGAAFSHITKDRLIQTWIPVLGEAVDMVGGPQIRNIGTIGGNVCNGATSADSASTLFTLNAVLELAGPDGVRQVPIAEFYTGPGRTVRCREEILTAIRIAKKDYKDFFGKYIKYGKRNAMEIATLGCAVHVKLAKAREGAVQTGMYAPQDKKYVEELRIAYGVAAPTPVRCRETERKAAGMPVGPELIAMVGKSVLEEVNPRSSWRASKEFRVQLVEEMAKRALTEALVRAGVPEDVLNPEHTPNNIQNDTRKYAENDAGNQAENDAENHTKDSKREEKRAGGERNA